MEYIGEYKLQIENGKVRFPWVWNEDENKIWIASESFVDGIKATNYVIIGSAEVESYISEKENHEEKFRILSLGKFVLDSDKIWEIPDIILKHLKTDDIIFCGIGSFVEIMSAEDMENYTILLDELEKTLKKTAIEEGVYKENTK